MCTKKTILKGLHRPIALPAFLNDMGMMPVASTKTLKRWVKFHPNCAYDLKNDKQGDWNKLFGVCCGWDGIHKESIRFGWRYSVKKQCIELCTIVYHDGKPERLYIGDLNLNQWARLDISININATGCLIYDFVTNGVTIHTGSLGNIGSCYLYGCGLYFGGKSRAPHKMNVTIQKR